MNTIELLAPAGSFEAFQAAVLNGADAIYVGGSAFSARSSATNFTNEELDEATKFAHLHNVKIYVAVNTLYEDHQFNELYEYISFLYEHQIDALIIQDMGLFWFVKEYFPDFEIHISTQASIYNKEAVEYFASIGASRVVLARENSIEEIREICKDSRVEIEAFVHGALCMSYSGQCLFSSFIGKRSGNKGACAQPCRLGYHFLKNNKVLTKEEQYLLSPKDLCTIEDIHLLLDAGVTSFKIEGRMKRPEYVATIVKAYRKAIDDYLKHKQTSYQNEIFAMKSMFNRGFTKGHLLHDGDFLTKELPGNQGIQIGTIVNYDPKTKQASIKLNRSLHQNDRLLIQEHDFVRTVTKLYYKGRFVSSGQVGDIVQIDLDYRVTINQPIYRVYDIEQIQLAKSTYSKDMTKFPIHIQFCIDKQSYIPTLIGYFDGIECKIVGSIPFEVALNRSLEKDRIIQQLSKFGNSLYTCKSIQVDVLDGYTFPIKELNEMRRKLIDLIDEKRKEVYTRNQKQPLQQLIPRKKDFIEAKKIIKIHSTEQLNVVQQYDIEAVFIPVGSILDYAYDSKLDREIEIIPYFPFLVSQTQVLSFIESDYFTRAKQVLVGDHGALNMLQDLIPCILDSHFNCCNSYSLKQYEKHAIVLSREMSANAIQKLNGNQRLYSYIYGYVPSMHLRHCIISNYYFGQKREGCGMCKQGTYQLSDRKKSRFSIVEDELCNNTVYHDRPVFFRGYQNLAVDYVIIDFTIENKEEIQEIMNYFYLDSLNISSNQLYTNGYFLD